MKANKNEDFLKSVIDLLNNQSSIKGFFGSTQKNHKSIEGELKLIYNNKTFQYKPAVFQEIRAYHIKELIESETNYLEYILISPIISKPVKNTLRSHGISYIDGAGNIFLQQADNLVWLDGFKKDYKAREIPNRAFTKTGLKVVFTILSHKDSINLPYRELAKLANVSIGSISTAIAGLKSKGYITTVSHERIILKNKQALLDRWVTGYTEILKPSLYLGTFLFKVRPDWRQFSLPDGVVWGGEAAGSIITDYLVPETLSIYTSGSATSLVEKMLLVPNENGNLKIYQKFWPKDAEIAMSKSRVAPYLVVYADLLSSDDPRCKETAEMIYKTYIYDSI